MDTGKYRHEKYMLFALILIICGYLAAFTLINFRGFTHFASADMYADTVVAKYMWQQKTLFPAGWVFGNQYYVVTTPVLSALFYGITGSVNLSMSIATSVMTALIILALIYAIKPFASRTQALVATLALMASIIAIDMGKVEAQILFLMCSYYAGYLITLLVCWGVWLRAVRSARGRGYDLMFALSVLLSFATGMQSMRA